MPVIVTEKEQEFYEITHEDHPGDFDWCAEILITEEGAEITWNGHDSVVLAGRDLDYLTFVNEVITEAQTLHSNFIGA